jgi:hypothetical protein
MVPPRTPAFRGRIPSAAVQQPGPSSHPTLRWRKADPNLPCNRIRSAFASSKLCYRFGPLTPSARSANLIAGDGTKNGLPAPNKEPATKPKTTT